VLGAGGKLQGFGCIGIEPVQPIRHPAGVNQFGRRVADERRVLGVGRVEFFDRGLKLLGFALHLKSEFNREDAKIAKKIPLLPSRLRG
jgi:hypothetical protein